MEEDTGASTPAVAPGAGKAAKEEEEDEEVQVGARLTSHSTHGTIFMQEVTFIYINQILSSCCKVIIYTVTCTGRCPSYITYSTHANVFMQEVSYLV